MSAKHPIVGITGSSGAGTTSVMRVFEQIQPLFEAAVKAPPRPSTVLGAP